MVSTLDQKSCIKKNRVLSPDTADYLIWSRGQQFDPASINMALNGNIKKSRRGDMGEFVAEKTI